MPVIPPANRLIDKFLFVIFFLAVLSVLSISIYRFWYQKDFTVLVEASCDQTTMSCYVRDCETEECPPNALAEYQIFSVSAAEFQKCADETCLAECANEMITCEQILCGSNEEDVCSQ